ncbi:MAG: di-heme oxidoredictase family protein [bacterium]
MNHRNIVREFFSTLFVALILALPIFSFIGCDTLLTEATEPHTTLEEPFDELTPAELAAFARGDAAFEEEFTGESGLGPIFNNTACGSCHPGDGRAHPSAVFKLFGRTQASGFDLLAELGGPQLQNRSLPGVPAETLPPEANAVSVRAAPPVFGVGLMEYIPVAAILANEDPDDAKNGDGVSGRAHWVEAPDWVPANVVGGGAGPQLGRFGLKANTSSLLQQVARAYHQDIGITTDFIPVENFRSNTSTPGDLVADPELPAATVQDVVFYIRMLAPPNRGEITAEVQQGETIFSQSGCATCHVPKFNTGPSPFKALAFREVALYSDLLLHDMGPALADEFIDGDAAGPEWKTKPLWGLGRTPDALGGVPYYLHDARTSDLTTAIMLHGGEAQKSRENFAALAPEQRRALLAFLNSL